MRSMPRGMVDGRLLGEVIDMQLVVPSCHQMSPSEVLIWWFTR